MGLEGIRSIGHACAMSNPHDLNPHTHTPALRRTLRDSLIEAEQLRHPVRLTTAGGRSLTGVLTEVGIDFAEVQTEDRPVDIALFYIESVSW